MSNINITDNLEFRILRRKFGILQMKKEREENIPVKPDLKKIIPGKERIFKRTWHVLDHAAEESGRRATHALRRASDTRSFVEGRNVNEKCKRDK